MRTTSPWNRVWLKESAMRIAEAHRGSEGIPMAARWNMGEGRVLAVAFDPMPGLVERLGSLVSRPPHDPRFHVSWETGPTLKVLVDAIDNGKYLNGKSITIELAENTTPEPAVHDPFSNPAPGQYQVTIPASRSGALQWFVSVRRSSRDERSPADMPPSSKQWGTIMSLCGNWPTDPEAQLSLRTKPGHLIFNGRRGPYLSHHRSRQSAQSSSHAVDVATNRLTRGDCASIPLT